MAPAAMTFASSLSDAQPVSYWLDDPAKPGALLLHRPATSTATSSSSAADTADCGPRCSPRSATQGGTSY